MDRCGRTVVLGPKVFWTILKRTVVGTVMGTVVGTVTTCRDGPLPFCRTVNVQKEQPSRNFGVPELRVHGGPLWGSEMDR